MARGGRGVNVLKPHQKSSVLTRVEREVSQHEISRKTGADRKTIRKLARAVGLALAGGEANSPMATGSDSLAGQIPPPRPPAIEAGGSAGVPPKDAAPAARARA